MQCIKATIVSPCKWVEYSKVLTKKQYSLLKLVYLNKVKSILELIILKICLSAKHTHTRKCCDHKMNNTI